MNMSKHKTEGERLMRRHFDATFDGDLEILSAAKSIDRAIRRAKAEAWDEGFVADYETRGSAENPYRWREKR